jgi:RNA polymerase sigma-B factor
MRETDQAGTARDGTLQDLDVAALDYSAALLDCDDPDRASLRTRFVEECLPFAGRLARRYRGRGEPLDDLEQAARMGLVKAIDRYDPERGSFTAYAVMTITGELKRHFRDTTWAVHVPRRVQDLTIEVNRARLELTATLSRPPTTAEIAARLGVSLEDIAEAVASSAGYSPVSLNAPTRGTDGAAELGELLGDVDRELEAVDDSITVAELMLRLPSRERKMLMMRFHGNKTQAEIAAELGISQMHVSRTLSRTLAWLREAMVSDTVPRWRGAGVPSESLTMRVSTCRTDQGLTVRVVGEVDRDSAERLRLGLRHAIQAAAGIGHLIIDLTDMPLIDAAGLAVLTEAAETAEPALQLVGVQRYVARVLAVAGLSKYVQDRR